MGVEIHNLRIERRDTNDATACAGHRYHPGTVRVVVAGGGPMEEVSRPERVIVIGASSSGVESLSRLAADLPLDIPAAVLMVLHIGERSFRRNCSRGRARCPLVTRVEGSNWRRRTYTWHREEGTCLCMIPTCCCGAAREKISRAHRACGGSGECKRRRAARERADRQVFRDAVGCARRQHCRHHAAGSAH